jgi:hypothetical protein
MTHRQAPGPHSMDLFVMFLHVRQIKMPILGKLTRFYRCSNQLENKYFFKHNYSIQGYNFHIFSSILHVSFFVGGGKLSFSFFYFACAVAVGK